MLQTDDRLKPISFWGCFFMVLGHVTELFTGRKLTPGIILKVYAEAVCAGIINVNCHVYKPEKLIPLIGRELGFILSIDTWYQWPDEVEPRREYDYYSEMRHTTGNTDHFLMPDYNPDPTIKVTGLVSKRFYKLKGKIAL
jgi:hypothetical protein